MHARILTGALLCGLLGGPGLCPAQGQAAQEQAAQEQVEDPLAYAEKRVNEALNILRSRNEKDKASMEKARLQLHKILAEVFDMPEISTRALARNKRKFKPEQFTEFNELFTRLLFETYLTNLNKYAQEEINFLSRKDLAPGRVIVATEVVKDGVKYPINYSMHLVKNKWMVYDVQVEGVSLSKNYRTQFREILMNKKPEQLIELLRKKVADLEKKGPDK